MSSDPHPGQPLALLKAFRFQRPQITLPEDPSTQYVRTLVPKAIEGIILKPESLNIGYLSPLGGFWNPKTSFWRHFVDVAG